MSGMLTAGVMVPTGNQGPMRLLTWQLKLSNQSRVRQTFEIEIDLNGIELSHQNPQHLAQAAEISWTRLLH